MNKRSINSLVLTVGFALIVIASQAVWVTFSPIVTNAAQELGVSVYLVGLLAITYPIFFLILTIPSGVLLDRNFKRWLMFGVFTTFFAAVGRFAYLNYWWLIFCQLFGALGQPFLLNAFVVYASQVYGDRRRPFVVSILSFSMYFGTVLALALGTVLYAAGGIGMVMLPAALIAVVGLVLSLSSITQLKFVKLEEKKILDKFGAIVKRRDLWLLGLILGFGIAAFDNLSTWLQPALENVGLEQLAGDAVALSIVLGLIGAVIIPRTIAKRDVRTIYLRIVTVIIAVFFGLLAIFINEALLFSFLGISGFLMIPAYPIIMDWIGKYNEEEVHGSVTGFVGLVSRVISVSLTLVAIYFISTATIYFTYLAIPIMIAFFLSLMLPRDRVMEKFRKRPEEHQLN